MTHLTMTFSSKVLHMNETINVLLPEDFNASRPRGKPSKEIPCAISFTWLSWQL